MNRSLPQKFLKGVKFRRCERTFNWYCTFALLNRSKYFVNYILCISQTYEELMDLAEKGNSLNLDMTEAEITSKADPESDDTSDVMDEIYGKYAKLSPRPTFLWGKAVASDTCKR